MNVKFTLNIFNVLLQVKYTPTLSVCTQNLRSGFFLSHINDNFIKCQRFMLFSMNYLFKTNTIIFPLNFIYDILK